MADTKELFNTVDKTAEFEQEDIQSNKVMGILAYIGILVLVPIFAAKNSKFARFNANQGLVLLIAEVAISFTATILGFIPKVGGVLSWLVYLLMIPCVILAVLGIVNAAKGQVKELPVIGKFKILK